MFFVTINIWATIGDTTMATVTRTGLMMRNDMVFFLWAT
jgi:hypothetical protein